MRSRCTNCGLPVASPTARWKARSSSTPSSPRSVAASIACQRALDLPHLPAPWPARAASAAISPSITRRNSTICSTASIEPSRLGSKTSGCVGRLRGDEHARALVASAPARATSTGAPPRGRPCATRRASRRAAARSAAFRRDRSAPASICRQIRSASRSERRSATAQRVDHQRDCGGRPWLKRRLTWWWGHHTSELPWLRSPRSRRISPGAPSSTMASVSIRSVTQALRQRRGAARRRASTSPTARSRCSSVLRAAASRRCCA